MTFLATVKYLFSKSAAPLFVLLLFMDHFDMSGKKLISVDFEVYGRVQGVFFRKHTQQESRRLGLKGWCMNTEKGTVQGVIQGDASRVTEMKMWLKTKGSPSSKIEKVDFSNEKEIKEVGFSNFTIKR